jgi:glutamate/tyrosine decarboxylase-like PLP-dependent enzyme
MTFDHNSLPLLAKALEALEKGFDHLPDFQPQYDREAVAKILTEAAERLHENFPYHHPLYCGQMLKPPHPIARLAYALAMYLNPNNHALDGGRASSIMEKEAVAQIAKMFGWPQHLGHLTSGGTFANLESLWISRELRPNKAIAASTQAHYTHSRVCSVLGIPFQTIDADPLGRIDLQALETALKTGTIGTVVATLGTTAAGTVDPLHEIVKLQRKYEFRIHVDAAYGGYFTLAGNLRPETRLAFDQLAAADSIVIDPHKHGLQPYGCGCVLFRDPAVGKFYQHHSPYTYFTSNELHLGEISLECSRPGASAVALWATLQLLPLERGAQFSRGLESGRAAALQLYQTLQQRDHFTPLFEPELDIVVWAARAESASESSALARQIFSAAAKNDLHLAVATFPRGMVERCSVVKDWDTDQVTCLRACIMKPEHKEWMPDIIKRLNEAVAEVRV